MFEIVYQDLRLHAGLGMIEETRGHFQEGFNYLLYCLSNLKNGYSKQEVNDREGAMVVIIFIFTFMDSYTVVPISIHCFLLGNPQAMRL